MGEGLAHSTSRNGGLSATCLPAFGPRVELVQVPRPDERTHDRAPGDGRSQPLVTEGTTLGLS
jgi:hypothetical protein